jgi:quercetin dioxygenase-like cupin family protein
MRAGLIGAFVFVAAAGMALAQTPAPLTTGQTYDIPPGSKDQTVMILTRDFKPGESSGAHIHHGVEMAQVIAGTVEIRRAGMAPETVKAGGSFLIPRETPHEAINVGTDVARLAITFVIDKGTPPRTPVDESLIK